MNKVNVLTNLKTILLNYRANEFVDSTRRNSRLDNDSCTFRTNLHYFFNCTHYITSINFLRELVIRSRYRYNVYICLLILSGELNTCLYRSIEKFIKTIFLESCLTLVESVNQFLVVICTDYLNAMRRHHEGGRKADITQSNYINHDFNILKFLFLLICRKAQDSHH